MEKKELLKVQKTVIPLIYQALPVIPFKTYRKYRPEFKSPLPLLDLCSNALDAEPFPNCWLWEAEQVIEFIRELGFPEFEEVFAKNNINGQSMLLLEADKFPKTNIKNFNNIKIITAAIRNEYGLDQDEFSRCVDLPIRRPRTLYYWYKCRRNGPTANFMRSSTYFKKARIILDETTEDRRYHSLLNHWNRIPPFRKWCPHVLLGNSRRINPMTGTTMRQKFKPKDHPYLLKDLCIYSLPCVEKQTKSKTRRYQDEELITNLTDYAE